MNQLILPNEKECINKLAEALGGAHLNDEQVKSLIWVIKGLELSNQVDNLSPTG